jgi:hypothetical protein
MLAHEPESAKQGPERRNQAWNRKPCARGTNQRERVGPRIEAQLKKSFSEAEVRGRTGAREEDPRKGACWMTRSRLTYSSYICPFVYLFAKKAVIFIFRLKT